jgi:hypothetical protein
MWFLKENLFIAILKKKKVTVRDENFNELLSFLFLWFRLHHILY